jgi:hypothetical protein
VYQAPDKTFYINARMNRAESAARYAAMIRENERVAAALLAQARALPGTLDAYTALNFAHRIAVATDNFQFILEVLDPRTVSQKPSYGSADAVKLLLQHAARAIIVRVQVAGDVGGRAAKAFSQSFTARGFRTAGQAANYTHLLSASLELENVDSGPNQRFVFVRYVLNASLEDAGGIEAFVFSGNDRAGHASQSEARQLALRKVESSIEDDAGEGFAREFDAWLLSLLQ